MIHASRPPLQHAPRSHEVLQHTYHFTELQIRAQLPRPAYIIELQNSGIARHHTAPQPQTSSPHSPPARAHFKMLWCEFLVNLELVFAERDRNWRSHHRYRTPSKILWCAFLTVLNCPARPHPVIIRQRSMPPPEKYYGDEKNRGGDKERG